VTAVNIVGIDLSGPSNPRGTCVVVLRCHRDSAVFAQSLPVAGDAAILNLVTGLSCEGQVVVGLDAPLSYQPGGGLRLRDRSLRDRIVERGMRHGSVMPPTFNRMAYLTLRGLGVARLLGTLDQVQVRVIEVHPGATFCLRGVPLASVLAFKKRHEHRASLLEWLSAQCITSLPRTEPSDHFVAASGAALAAWEWSRGRSVWLAPPEPPFHPFAFAC
jgi:predicted nuclease with RNAse H fold